MAPEGESTDVKAGALAATASARAMPAGVKVRSRLVLHWADIAIDQEARAREGRAEIERVLATRETAFPLKAEFQPAMIGIAACAHSLDALYAELAEHVGPETLARWAETRRPGRWAEVAGILDLAVDRNVNEWRSRLKALFVDLRNPAIHPAARDRAPERHSVLPAHVPPEYRIYSIEAVEESIDLLLEILSACVEAPRPSIEAWANDTRASIEALKQSRVAPTK
jgi:hypothetical protein